MRCLICAILLTMTTTALAQTTQPDSAPTTNPSQPPAADQILSQMLHSTGDDHSSAAAAPPSTPAAPQPAAAINPSNDAIASGATSATIREGTDIVDRMGRVRKSNDTQQEEFVFESDGRALQDPPVILLPNLELMLMERAINASSHDLKFRITGTVTEYHARNYILLEKFVVVQDQEQQL
jgi:hypothetical protein